MLTRLLCELIPARPSYANSSLRCTKIEHTFLTVLKVGSTIQIGHTQKLARTKMSLWQKEDENNKNRPTLQPFKVFSENYNQHLSFIGKCNNSLVSTIINSTTEPSGILIRLMHSQMSCSEQNPSPQNMEGGTSSS